MAIQRNRLKSLLATALFALGAGTVGAQNVSQFPLSSGGSVPGNLVLTPSVEWPTLDSRANYSRDSDGNEIGYASATEYSGYFDPDKCYRYNYDSTVDARRFFYPVRLATSRTCTRTNQEWSGNFLNWAATQTIDPFRKALTGGYRVIDTGTETVLEKARSDSNTSAGIYGDRRLPQSGDNQTLVNTATAANWVNFNSRLRNYGNKMRFTSTGDIGGGTVVHYNPSSHSLGNTVASASTVYEVYIRVRVCDSTLLETNCIQYPNGNWKPEGLIQKYSGRMRYAAFGYLNDHATNRDGAPLRARMKYVGPTKIDPATGLVVANTDPVTGAEWDVNNGVLVQNPDAADATATTTAVGSAITNSGVINYINKFGQMTTKNHKSLDPVSEMYYAALRYLRNLPNISTYTDLTVGASNAAQRYELADGFPVISDWTDPFIFHCQRNAILGIGDVNTWNDKNLLGGARDGAEPAAPSFGADTVNVDTWTQRVAVLEGITIPTEFTGRGNSAYMVGLAYWAHTQDMRTEVNMPNRQTVSTYWVDVREAQVLQPRDRNQYWLAAKYGGFTVPRTGFDSTTRTAPLDTDWWYTNGEDLDPGAGVYQRADNFYVASDAERMVDSLTRAFARIASDRVGSGASLAANASRIDTTTRTFQALYLAGNYGQLQSFDVNPDGSLNPVPEWTVGAPVAVTGQPGVALTRANAPFRNIHTNAGGTMLPFLWANLTAAQRTLMTFPGMPTVPVARLTTGAHVVDYIRGSDAREEDQTNGTLRTRIAPETGWSPILGDLVNSTPVFVGRPNDRLYTTATFNGASAYAAFVTGAGSSRLGVIWIGGNDGMLHAFDAATGYEVFAFIPNASYLRGLGQLANPDYEHRYFVDGDMAIADAWNGTSWRTILVGSMGRGGPGVFALDITNPLSPSFLWEKGVTEIPSLGRNIGKPVIAQTANGVWKVLFGNGVDSSAGSAQLIAINLFGGGTVTVSNTEATTNNGLSAVLPTDLDGDGFAETAYAGDLAGNLWKFTGINGTAASSKLFTAAIAGVPQPITAAPLAGRDPVSLTNWVFFGTGKFLNTGDLTSTATQTWYGIKDNGVATTRATLVSRTVVATGTIDDGDPATPASEDFTVRTMSEGTVDEMATRQGWYFDLPTSRERMVAPNQFQAGALIGTSRIPDATDVCQPTGSGFIMALNPFTGGRLDLSFYDTNRDGVFDEDDLLGGIVVSGIGTGTMQNAPLFIGGGSGSDSGGTNATMYLGGEDGSRRAVRTQGSGVQAGRMSWREVVN
jgi:type IV pilus assembly protein PilY1